MQFDVIAGGFGYQKTSEIVEQPAQVVSAESFVVKVSGQNIFRKQFMQSNIDPIKDLFVLSFAPIGADGSIEANSCVCSPETADICHHLSGSF